MTASEDVPNGVDDAAQIPTALAALPVIPKTGDEKFQAGAIPVGYCVLDFWRWSASDLVSNVTRGLLAEFIVAKALGIVTEPLVRDDWGSFDLTSPGGGKVEVKSAAFLQSWGQRKKSTILFQTPKTRAWDRQENNLSAQLKRQADVYVFALLKHEHKPTVNPLDLAQWEFYVVPSRVLNERQPSQHSISLKTLRALEPACGPLGYSQLRNAVEALRFAGAAASSL